MGDRRAILNNKHAASLRGARVVEPNRTCGQYDGCARIDRAQGVRQQRDVACRRFVDLVDDEHIGHAGHRLAGVMGGDPARTQSIGHANMKIGPDKRKVVIAAIPNNDLCLPLGQPQDRRVVGAGEYDIAREDVWFVFLALFDRAVVGLQIGQRR